jgi:NADP-dependent 3-hydroxy acid dehydrogenase YdfG
MVDTPRTRSSPIVNRLVEQSVPLTANDVARAVVSAFLQPDHVNVSEVALVPLTQAGLTAEEVASLVSIHPPAQKE